MSNFRQLDEGVIVRSYGVNFSLNWHAPPTSETWDQLVYATRGVLTVKTSVGTWVVPPHRAVWLPANTIYSLTMSGQTALRMIYLRKTRTARSASRFDRNRCAVVSVSPLLRELIVRAVQIGALESKSAHHRRLAGLIEDELKSIGTVPLQLPYPQNAVARRFTELVDEHIGAGLSVAELLAGCGSSRRTMERLFQAETAMSLGQWIRRRKLLYGLERLLKGDTTTDVAFNLGYNSPSAFIAMFKRELGETPGDSVRTVAPLSHLARNGKGVRVPEAKRNAKHEVLDPVLDPPIGNEPHQGNAPVKYAGNLRIEPCDPNRNGVNGNG